MCVEFCWCLCIHKVSFRGACYFFASVHSYDGVRRLLNLVVTNVLLRTYFMDSRKTDLDMDRMVSEDSVELLAKSLYYLATTVTALMIFRSVEKEWRQLMQWTAVVFLTIEAVALGMYFVLHPTSYNSANCIATLSARFVFVVFYIISMVLYIRQLSREEAESEWKFQQSEWEPRFLGRSPGGCGTGVGLGLGLGGCGSGKMNGNLSGFGTLGFGENTLKWLEAEKVLPHPQLIGSGSGSDFVGHKGTIDNRGIGKDILGSNNDGKFEVRYEVCKSTKKF